MTRLAVLSDVHANTPALRAVAEDVRSRDVDGLVYLGDIVFRGPDPGGAIERMRTLQPLVWIRGNTDDWYVGQAPSQDGPGGYVSFGQALLTDEQRAFLGGLPGTGVVSVGAAQILCVHGSPRDPAENILPDTPLGEILAGVEQDVVVCGHTHLPFLGGYGGTIVFNVGSVGMPFDGDSRASYGLVSDSDGDVDMQIIRVHYDVSDTVLLARGVDMPHLERYEQTLRTGIASF